MIAEKTQSRLRPIASGLLTAVAAILIVLVIPLVRQDRFPGVARGPASIAFAVSALFHALLALWAFRSSCASEAISIWVGVFAPLLGLALMDAGFAFAGHPHMQIATAAIFACVLSDAAASVLVFTLAFLRSRETVKLLR